MWSSLYYTCFNYTFLSCCTVDSEISMIIWHSSVHFIVRELGECFVLHNKIGFIGHVVSRLMSSRFVKRPLLCRTIDVHCHVFVFCKPFPWFEYCMSYLCFFHNSKQRSLRVWLWRQHLQSPAKYLSNVTSYVTKRLNMAACRFVTPMVTFTVSRIYNNIMFN